MSYRGGNNAYQGNQGGYRGGNQNTGGFRGGNQGGFRGNSAPRGNSGGGRGRGKVPIYHRRPEELADPRGKSRIVRVLPENYVYQDWSKIPLPIPTDERLEYEAAMGEKAAKQEVGGGMIQGQDGFEQAPVQQTVKQEVVGGMNQEQGGFEHEAAVQQVGQFKQAEPVQNYQQEVVPQAEPVQQFQQAVVPQVEQVRDMQVNYGNNNFGTGGQAVQQIQAAGQGDGSTQQEFSKLKFVFDSFAKFEICNEGGYTFLTVTAPGPSVNMEAVPVE